MKKIGGKISSIGRRAQLAWQELIPWIIGLGVLILATTLYLILSDKGTGAIEYVRNAWGSGGVG